MTGSRDGVLIMAGVFPLFWIAQKEWEPPTHMIFLCSLLVVFTFGYTCFSVA